MSIFATDAPFMPGDRVIYRPLRAGIETVELVEYRREGWGDWYIGTRRQVVAHRYDRAELFDGPSSRWMPQIEGCPQAWPGSE